MNGLQLGLGNNGEYLDLTIHPAEVEDELTLKSLSEYVQQSMYGNYFLFDETIQSAFNKYKKAVKNETKEPVLERIGERRNAIVKFVIVEGEMSANLSMTAAFGGKTPSSKVLLAKAKKAGIQRGLSTKRMQGVLDKIKESSPGTLVEAQVAKGLPPRMGKTSRLRPLVPNALERILRPQASGNNRVDMRNLGDVICVKKGTEVLRRMPPTDGRSGYSVTGSKLESKPGAWVSFKPGEGTVLSDNDENLLLADINGMPKFKDQKMWVDDTFICTGVNVGSGNINYDGAVLVNGDVTEKMVIVAAGDVTVNGFVESATIQAGGDIIITEGAMGKVNEDSTDFSTKLVSQGSVHIQHGQGLDVSCNGNVTIGRQLAYSRIKCGGGVSVGPIDNPNGNLFACEIDSQDAVIAGTLGAVSGSHLSIDFSTGFNSLLERKDTLDELVKKIESNYSRHKMRMDLINSKRIPEDLRTKLAGAMELFKNESQLMQWMISKASDMKDAKDKYQDGIKLIANKRLYPGVVVKLNNRTWRADKEYARAKIFYEGHQWLYEPIL